MPVVMPPSSPVVSGTQVITLVQIYDYLFDDSGKAVSKAQVQCTLNIASATAIAPPLQLGPIRLLAMTDANGFFAFNVVANNNILPVGTLYLIETPFRAYNISVPSGGPYQTMSIVP